MYNEQRLHIGILITKAFKRLTTLFVPLFIYTLVKPSDGAFLESLLISVSVLTVVLLFGLIIDLIKYFRTSYSIQDNRFILKTGLVIRKEKDIQISRIQSIDTSESLIHRFLKITKVTIQTPGKNILLEAISDEQLDQIKSQINRLNTDIDSSLADPDTHTKELFSKSDFLEITTKDALIFQLSIKEIIKMALLNTSFMQSLFLFLTVGSFLSNNLEISLFDQVESLIVQTSIALLFLIILSLILFVYLTRICLMVIKQYQFSVFLSDKQLTIKRGLLETNSQTIVLENVQSIEEQQNILMKCFGYTTLSLSIATEDEEEDDSSDKNDEAGSGKVILFPLIKTDQLAILVQSCFPEYDFLSAKLITPKRSIRRFIQFRMLFWIATSVIISALFWSYAWVICVVFIVINLSYGYRSQQLNGYALSQNEITLQVAQRFSIKKTYIPKNRILNFKFAQNPFLKKANLAKVVLFSAQGQLSQNIKLNFVEEVDAFQLFEWFRSERGELGEYESN
ncbi:PH domain-containing protein [Marinilactibacillus sp. GCM10026970]|uniref:PH domain-containing protein n=1 Tax=Marinilactibacillus sp. GCM10026970 TaxID=3252642 RepID=UPI00360728BD